MAVNYETGIASSPTDLLGKLATFAGGLGWTFDVPASGDYVIHKGNIYAGVDATATQIQTRPCTGFNGAAAWDAQPGASATTHITTPGAGPFTAYHFFVGDEDGSEYIHVVIEISANNFRHWVLGDLIKSGAYTGGTYSDSTLASTSTNNMDNPDYDGHRFICDTATSIEHGQVWCDFDGAASPNWVTIGFGASQAGGGNGTMRLQGLFHAFHEAGPSEWNLRTPLIPLMYLVNRASSLRSVVGRIPHMRQINLTNLSPGEIITYGSDDWMVFPVFIRRTTAPGNGVLSSGIYGYAYRR